MKKIRMRMTVSGAHLGNPDGSKVGDVLEVEDGIAEQYIRAGYASLVADSPKVETTVAPEPPETAALSTVGGATATATATVTPTETPTETPAKRGPGRPRKE